MGSLTIVRYDATMPPEERLRQLCREIAEERDLQKVQSLLRQLEFTLAEYGLDLQNRAVFLSHPSGTSDSRHK